MREIVASQSGREVISLQKMDSLILFLNVTEKLRRFLRCNAGGIWIKIYLNPKWEFQLRMMSGGRKCYFVLLFITTGSSLILWFILSFASNTFNAPKLIIINSRTTMFVHNFDWKKYWGIWLSTTRAFIRITCYRHMVFRSARVPFKVPCQSQHKQQKQ